MGWLNDAFTGCNLVRRPPRPRMSCHSARGRLEIRLRRRSQHLGVRSWRVVTADGIAHGDEDDGQQFGLPQPVDGEAQTNDFLQGQRLTSVEIDGLTADLRLVFDGGARLDFFNNSAGYEGWQASVLAGGKGLVFIALGGGKLLAR